MSLTLHTSHGDLKIELYCELVPQASRNFLALAASGYYDGTTFHRLIKQFLVQGGDPTGKGKGGESVDGGFFNDEFVDCLRHDRRGTVSMANRGPNTNGSQFFITFAPQPQLDYTSTLFGHVINGFETLDSMERVRVNKKYRPEDPITLSSISIHANPFAQAET